MSDADLEALFDAVVAGRTELLTLRRKMADLQQAAESGDTHVVTALGLTPEEAAECHELVQRVCRPGPNV